MSEHIIHTVRRTHARYFFFEKRVKSYTRGAFVCVFADIFFARAHTAARGGAPSSRFSSCFFIGGHIVTKFPPTQVYQLQRHCSAMSREFVCPCCIYMSSSLSMVHKRRVLKRMSSILPVALSQPFVFCCHIQVCWRHIDEDLYCTT